MTLSTPEEVEVFHALRSARAPKVEWLDGRGHACPRTTAQVVRLTKYAGRGLKAVFAALIRAGESLHGQ